VIEQRILHYLLLSWFFSFYLYANIDAQIEAIQKAPIEERFKLMNAFKKEVVQMQEEERISAIGKLKSITRSKHSERALKELRTYSHPTYLKKIRKVDKTQKPREHHAKQKNDLEEQIENETEEHIETEIEDEVEHYIEDEHDDDDDDD